MKLVDGIDGELRQDGGHGVGVGFQRPESESVQSKLSSSVWRCNNALTLSFADEPQRAARGVEPTAHCRLAVRRAVAYIHRHLGDSIRLSHLCRYSGAQARSLEYAFRALLGVSPMAYVRTARLQRANESLRSAAVYARSISEIALDCGFSHLSQFAVDYKRLFGESPSATARDTRERLTRAALVQRSSSTAVY